MVNAAAGSALIWWLVGPPPPVQGWLLASVAVLLAWFLDFCIASLIGLSAFVAEEVSASLGLPSLSSFWVGCSSPSTSSRLAASHRPAPPLRVDDLRPRTSS
ncbi:MAG: hypothetical protein R2856_18095 [Caldilineaceae bacterium]